MTLSNNTTGSAPGNGGGVHITGPGNMTITGCTVTGNMAALEGGGLWNGTGTMTVNSSTIGGNTAAGALATRRAGGIFNNAKGTLIVENGTMITNNLATGAAGSGGGILCDSTATLTVSNSTIDGNSAPRAGGGIEFFAKAGQLQTASLMNVTISDNTTGSAPGNGGGVHITGPGNMTVTGCTVMGNTAAAEGGGLWNGSGTMTIDDCDVSGNVANGSVNPVGAPGGALDLQGGGGIFNNLGTVNIVNISGATNITGNTAGGAPFGSGGGILSAGGSFSITGANISMNETARAGGGIENAASSMTVTSSVINGNDCSLAGALAAASPGNGGGVHVTGAGTMTVSMCTVDGNTAGNEGGGLWGSGTGTLTVLRTTASNNTAPDGGGLFLQAGPTGVLNMDFSTSSGNTATNGGGAQTEGGTFNITGSTIASNTASTGGGVNVIATAVNSTSTIIADNTAGTGPDLNGAFASAMFTLLENGTGATGIMNGSNGNIVGTDPILQALANNGGPTGTHALACGSAAVDAGDPALMENDQRGTPVQGMARDMGAFEQDAAILLSLEIQADGVSTILWELRAEGTNTLVANGGQLYPSGPAMESICIAAGCYYLVVTDDGGDGILNGGYVLREEASGMRIIDNTGNFSTGSVSAISGGQGFCLPLSDDKLLFTSCDKLDWISGQYVVAAPNAAVSAEWIPNGANNVQDANSGYEFWIFDPNGSYSFRRFRSHSQSDGFGPASATRACHMKLNNWAAASHVPANVLMNVRVRARINSVNGAFGPACRLEVDPVLAACPLTNLMDVPGNSQFSCGVTRQFGPGNYVYARPVSGANRYQFRFSQPNEGVVAVRTSTNYILQLNWVTGALLAGETYDVEVRVSKNNGATWCTNDAVWGPVCQLTIGAPGAALGSANFAGIADVAELRMFPNPNRGDVLNFSISAIEEGVNTVSMDIYDLTGKRVSARTIAVADGNVNMVIDLNGELAAGMYLVNITAGENTYTERLVIQP
ncbi:MAG: T9SS type A sorting domain-containing protein [Flavobacteriales bacterium]|nr:T9SS type A sorting domain-containing protein [Flavobacteriales bacterium]